MTAIQAGVDAYGTYVRASAVADLLEVQALGNPSLTLAELADFIRDTGFVRKLREPFAEPDEEPALFEDPEDAETDQENLPEAVDQSAEAAGRSFQLLRQRALLLGDRYPFAIVNGRLSWERNEAETRPYLTLLATTIIHAYDVPSAVAPTTFFEDFVTEALIARGLLAANVAKNRRAGGTFADAIIQAGEECRIGATPEAATVRRLAQEEGCDVLAHHDWLDARPIPWVYVLQATCAVSDQWKKKLYEPGEGLWRRALGSHTSPRFVLAVPHHVCDAAIRYFLEHADGERLLLDRIRLATPGVPLGADAEALVAELESVTVDFG